MPSDSGGVPPSPWLATPARRRWAMILPFLVAAAVVFAAEGALRVLENTNTYARPVRYRLIHMDEKRDAFLHRFDRAAPGRRVLILGSSNGDTNLDPTTLALGLERATGQRHVAFNGAMFGARLRDNLFFLEWYHRHWPFHEVVFSIEPGVLRPGHLEGLAERLDAPAIENWLRDNTMLYAVRGQLRPYRTADNERTMAWDAVCTDNGWNRTIVWRSPVPHDQQVRDVMAGFREWRLDPALLEEIAAWCRERGIAVSWVIVPWRPDAQAALPPGWTMPEVAALARDLAQRHGQRVVDLSEARFPIDDFWDPAHFTGPGAMKCTALLADRLGRLVTSGVASHREPPTDIGDEWIPTWRLRSALAVTKTP